MSIKPVSLTCESRQSPLGVDVSAPRLGWILQQTDNTRRGAAQSAYQVQAASSAGDLIRQRGILWDTHKVASNQTSALRYAGQPLRSAQECWWRVRAWDEAGKPSAWSAPSRWIMGLLAPRDWGKSRWIGAPAALQGDDNSTVLLRGTFNVKPGLRRALVFVCGLGQYEMTVNGAKPANTLLNPGWTEYKKTCLYDTYEITSLLKTGPNAAGLLLGNGMYRVGTGRYHKFLGSYGPLQAIAQIRLEYTDGTNTIIGTDSAWQAGTSPMVFSSVYGGEDWDARAVQKGWDRPGFHATGVWTPAMLLTGPGGALKGMTHAAPPVQAFQRHAPISAKVIVPNTTIYDLGQTASHMVRFTVHGPAGSVVKITPDELLMPDGTLFHNNYNGKAWSNYTLSGQGTETYAAKFYYGGNRYYQVECLPAPGSTEIPHIDSIEGVVVHTSSAEVGEFSCSNPLFNQIFSLIKWAEVSNMMSVVTDCPHRERLGWLEQDHLHGPSFRYNFDMTPLMTKTISDMSDSQDPDGLIPSISPEYMKMSGVWRDPVEWGSSGVLVPWQEYQWTGELDVLRRNYPMMKRYVEHVTSLAKKGIAAPGLGDWQGQRASPATPKPLVATAIYYADAEALAQSALALGDTAEAAAQEHLASSIREAFNAAFFHPETNQYGTGSQSANAMALALGLVDPERKGAVLANLVSDLEARKYELTVGEIGLPFLFRALAEGGRSDVVYAMNNQTDRPGYGYQIKQGATALCETWNADRDNSQVQFMLGHIMEWFYHDLAGIQADPKTPGFARIVIHPAIVGDLTEAKASYHSLHGKIASEWKRANNTLQLDVTIPVNATATIYVPTTSPDAVTESGHSLAKADGITVLPARNGCAVCAVKSGTYKFIAPLSNH